VAAPDRPQPQSRNAYLDLLRGIAVLIVVFSHASNLHRHVIPGLDVHGVGKAGVWLFFVLSAFLLTRKLVDAFAERPSEAPRTLLRYGINRVFRILPLYLLVLAVHAWLIGDNREDGWRFLWRHALMLEGQREFWVIPVEVKYYAVMPLFCLLHVFLWRGRFLPAALFLGAASLFCIWEANLGAAGKNSLHLWPYFPIFACGSLLAVMPEGLFRRWASPGAAFAAAACLAVPLGFVIGGSQTATMEEIYVLSPLLALFWSVVLAWGLVPGRVRPPRFLVFVGRISFSVYLIHYPLLLVLMKWPFLPQGAVGILTLLLTLPIAWLTWRTVEQPCITTGKRWGESI